VLARREALALALADPTNRDAEQWIDRTPDAPLLLTGHQPELAHPGVWVKNFALFGLARKIGGIALNLVVDNDTLKDPSLQLPTLHGRDPRSVQRTRVAYDTFSGEVPFEERRIENADGTGAFASFADRAALLWSNWGFVPLLPSVWPHVVQHAPEATIGQRFAMARRRFEAAWGCANLDLTVSQLAEMDAFRRFAEHIRGDLPRFRTIYNRAIHKYRTANRVRSTNHPAPELAPGEAPFWVRTATGRRGRATALGRGEPLRPRALTLTLFARLCLGDFFIHGIGGGKYDEVTDTIIREYFGIEPPAYQVLSATLHLPLPDFPATPAAVRQAASLLRDLSWNPQRHLSANQLAEPSIAHRAAVRRELAATAPPLHDRAGRRAWFQALQRATNELRPSIAELYPEAEANLARLRREIDANATLHRRDYSWVLFPEETIRPFLQQFLSI
jgi:hypothetical protein